jgi:hypothetical protein
MKKPAIAITVVAVLTLLVLAVLRAQASRELILKRNGLPLASLKGKISPGGVARPSTVPTSTDANGRLDLRSVPRESEQIIVELWDGAGTVVRNTGFQLPTSGSSKVVDFRGSRTICTTTRTYADFVLFQLTVQEVLTWDQDETEKEEKLP